MDIFSVLTLLGGLAMFLYGMQVMGTALEKRAGGKMKGILEKLTSSPVRGVLLGAAITAVIQSSSATTVMVVGFVNSGIMKLGQAISVIMGANIGTTITAWIISLTGIQGDGLLISLLKPSSFSPVLAFIGVIMLMMGKKSKQRDTGTILLGFAVLMYGMQLMSGAVAPLSDDPNFARILTLFKNPILGVLTGALVTGIIQSSSASVGILQALSATGSMSYGAAIPIIMGQNIGTCVTALISSVGTNKNARRTAIVHLYFNIIGTTVFLTLFLLINRFIGLSFVDSSIDAAGIALVHTAFNVGCTLLLMPFTRQLEKLAVATVRDDGEQEAFQMLDKRLFSTPSIAVERCHMISCDMARLCREALTDALKLRTQYSDAAAQKIYLAEDKLDEYEDKLGSFLVELSTHDITKHDSRLVAEMLHAIGDMERIGDHAVHIAKSAEEINEKKVAFSPAAQSQISVIAGAVHEIADITLSAYEKDDLMLAKKVEPLEQVIDKLKDEIRSAHIQRLQSGECTIELGFILSDILNDYGRVSDHCSNIAATLIETDHKSLALHEYTGGVKNTGDPEFERYFGEYDKRFSLS